MAATDLEHSDAALLDPIMVGMFEQFIVTGLLLSHHHSYSERLHRREKPIAPRDIKRAIDFVQANLDAPMTLADLVEVSGVAGRTLFKHFQEWRGISPMRYVRNARFDKDSYEAVRLRFIRTQRDEVDAIEAFGTFVWDIRFKDFNAEYDLARITWDDGWHDAIRKRGSGHEKAAFEPGKTFDDSPSNVTVARSTEHKEI